GSLGVASPPPYLFICNTSSSIYLRGVNFASGGSGVSELINKGQCISFDEHIDQHYSNVHATLVQQLGQAQASIHLAKSLFVVAIGGNDIINHVLLSPIGQLIGSQDQFISSLAKSLKHQLQSMYDLRSRRLFFVGAAPLPVAAGAEPQQGMPRGGQLPVGSVQRRGDRAPPRHEREASGHDLRLLRHIHRAAAIHPGARAT
ncbi:hypothetical protein E2562_013402, partial [Oryza meyeriana var. granulata]